MQVISPTNLRKDIYQIFKNIVKDKKPIEVTLSKDNGFNNGVIVMDKTEYNRLKELEYLESTGTLKTVFQRMKNSKDEDFVDL